MKTKREKKKKKKELKQKQVNEQLKEEMNFAKDLILKELLLPIIIFLLLLA